MFHQFFMFFFFVNLSFFSSIYSSGNYSGYSLIGTAIIHLFFHLFSLFYSSFSQLYPSVHFPGYSSIQSFLHFFLVLSYLIFLYTIHISVRTYSRLFIKPIFCSIFFCSFLSYFFLHHTYTRPSIP